MTRISKPTEEDPVAPAVTDLARDLHKRFLHRPETPLRPGLALHAEELLERLKDPAYPSEDLARTLAGLLHDVTIRLEPYLNSPFRGLEEVSLADPRLAPVAEALLEILATQVMPAAAERALDKATVTRHPGG
jgi:hypothetical protein